MRIKVRRRKGARHRPSYALQASTHIDQWRVQDLALALEVKMLAFDLIKAVCPLLLEFTPGVEKGFAIVAWRGFSLFPLRPCALTAK